MKPQSWRTKEITIILKEISEKLAHSPNLWRLTCFEAKILLLIIYLRLCSQGWSMETKEPHVLEPSRQRQIEMNLFNKWPLSFSKVS